MAILGKFKKGEMHIARRVEREEEAVTRALSCMTEKQETLSNGDEFSRDNGRKGVHGAEDEFATPSPRRLKRRKQSEYRIERSK